MTNSVMLWYYYVLLCVVVFLFVCLNIFAIHLPECLYCPATFTSQPLFNQVSCISIFQIKLNCWTEQKKWLKVGKNGGNNEAGCGASERGTLKAVTPEGWEYLQQRSPSVAKVHQRKALTCPDEELTGHLGWSALLGSSHSPLTHTHTHLFTHSLTHPNPADNVYSQTQHKVCRNLISTDHDQPRLTTRFLSFLINTVDREYNI